MDGTVYYYFGGALVLAALVLSYFGIRGKDSFPPSKGVFTGLAVAVAALVIGTGAYAVANAREEADHREHEQAEETAVAEEAVAEEEGAEPKGDAPAGGGGAETFDVTSPEDGSLSFDPPSINAAAGSITLAYENPSPVAHNIAIEAEGQEAVAESDTVTAGLTEVSGELAPGEYVYFCTIPGHREGGMEGVLTVE